MDYQKIYNDLIENARNKNRKKHRGDYLERHHIIPVCMKGSNNKENLVLLTCREHFVAHKLLAEIYPENSSIFFAYYLMSSFKFIEFKNNAYRVSSREYERLRFRNGEFTRQNFQKEETRNKHKNSQQKRWENMEEHEKHSNSLKKYYENPEAIEKNKRIQKEYWQDKPKPNEGREFSEEWIENIKKGQKKRFENPEERKKVSDFVKSQPPLVCPHCGKIGRSCVMYRHHFDNCTHKRQEVAA